MNKYIFLNILHVECTKKKKKKKKKKTCWQLSTHNNIKVSSNSRWRYVEFPLHHKLGQKWHHQVHQHVDAHLQTDHWRWLNIVMTLVSVSYAIISFIHIVSRRRCWHWSWIKMYIFQSTWLLLLFCDDVFQTKGVQKLLYRCKYL